MEIREICMFSGHTWRRLLLLWLSAPCGLFWFWGGIRTGSCWPFLPPLPGLLSCRSPNAPSGNRTRIREHGVPPEDRSQICRHKGKVTFNGFHSPTTFGLKIWDRLKANRALEPGNFKLSDPTCRDLVALWGLDAWSICSCTLRCPRRSSRRVPRRTRSTPGTRDRSRASDAPSLGPSGRPR